MSYAAKGGFVSAIGLRLPDVGGAIFLGGPGERDLVFKFSRLRKTYPRLIPPYVSPENPSPEPTYEERRALRFRDEQIEFMRRAKL